jgi:hypothetical protein
MKRSGQSRKLSHLQEAVHGRRRVMSHTVAQRLSDPDTLISIPRGEVVTWSGTSKRDWRRVHVSYQNDTWVISSAAWESAATEERY